MDKIQIYSRSTNDALQFVKNIRQFSAAGDEKFPYRAHDHQIDSAPGQNRRDERDYSAFRRGCVMRDCRIERNSTVRRIA